MKFHGLVMLAALGISKVSAAQNGLATPDRFVPPSPRQAEAGTGEPLPLPMSPAAETNSASSIEAELRQFRSELREFQVMREEFARSTQDAEKETDRSSLRQRQELIDLLTKLARTGVTRKKTKPDASQEVVEPIQSPSTGLQDQAPMNATRPGTFTSPPITTDIADPFALGKVLFRNGDFVGAEAAFRKTVVNPENEMEVKYLLATCLRRQSRWQQALDAYKVVAESNRDPVLSEFAKWQYDNIRFYQQSESQLEQMRKQRDKRLDIKSNGTSANATPTKH